MRTWILGLASLLFVITSWAQTPMGGGTVQLDNTPCLTPDQRAAISAHLAEQAAVLQKQGHLPAKMDGNRPQFSSPMQVNGLVAGFQPWFITNYMDHDSSFPNNLQDYMGGARTYDLDNGYNHAGTDIVLWPFSWDMMSKDEVAVVAAAPGTLLSKRDGNPDTNCVWEDGLQWNAVFLQHDDGSFTWYGHLKTNSLTDKAPGDRIERGEYLGMVGSSGFSTVPHLHFEVHDAQDNIIDPYAGPSNPTTATSWWIDQEDYYEGYVTKLLTHTAVPTPAVCPEDEIPAYGNHFQKGDEILIAVYYRDQQRDQQTTYQVVDPNGTVLARWDHEITQEHLAAAWWYWAFTPQPEHPDGVYRWEALYQGKTFTHGFAVGDVGAPVFDEVSLDRTTIGPGETVTLRWETSDALEVHIDQDVGYQAVDGSLTLSPTTSGTYTLTAVGLDSSTTAQVNVTVSAKNGSRIMAHVTPDNAAFATAFILGNPTEDNQPYLFKPYDSTGFALTEVSGFVQAGTTQHLSKQALFGNEAVSHFSIEADPQLAISAAYRPVNGGSPAHLSDQAIVSSRWRIYNGDWTLVWDGIAIVNRGDGVASVTIDQVDRNGQVIQSASLGDLDPKAKTLAIIEALGFSAVPETHFRIQANQPIAVTALRGQLGDSLYFWENRALPD